MVDLGLILLALIAAFFSIRAFDRTKPSDVIGPKQTQMISRLWQYVHAATKRQKWDTAEKALLKILKYDHKNVSAYNQLGMIYVRSDQPENAIACFDIASSLAPSVSSLYNLGLVQYREGNIDDAARSLERVIDLDATPKRILVFAKVLQQKGDHKKVVNVLKRAIEIEPSERNYQYLAEAYEALEEHDKAEEARQHALEAREQTPQQFHPKKMRT